MPDKATLTSAEGNLTTKVIWLMSIASGVSVANIYYLQPLLTQIAIDFNVAQSTVGLMPTLTQVGFALGLLLILPLADIVEKRRLLSIMLICSSCSLLLLFLASNFSIAAIASFFLGFTSIIPQLLIPLGAQLAKPQERGQVIGSIMAGLLIGILLSRVVSGLLGEIYGWQTIYLFAAILMLNLLCVLHFNLPQCPALTKINYQASLKSLIPILKQYPVLLEYSIIGAMIFFAFSAFWTALTFLLSGPDYHLGAGAAGLFGLVGIVGAFCSPFAGKFADKKGPRFAVGSNLLIITVAFSIFATFGQHIWGLIIGVILLDLGVQCCNVSSQARIHQLDETARSRVTAIYMSTYFLGGALGSYAGAWSFQHFSWLGVCTLGLLSQAIAGFCFLYGHK